YQPAWMEFGHKGTTHGSEFTYDTHVPLVFFGAGIPNGSTVNNIDIVDIAPTICMLLNIPFPNGCSGKPIEELFRK
ncbi:MAG: alkaline phosphatase family protein, partial [Bacteroidia bacterium]